jgi:Tfp pilus assembly protein PilE
MNVVEETYLMMCVAALLNVLHFYEAFFTAQMQYEKGQETEEELFTRLQVCGLLINVAYG